MIKIIINTNIVYDEMNKICIIPLMIIGLMVLIVIIFI